MACHSSATYFHSNELNHLSSRDFWKQTIIICATYKTKKPWNVFVRSFMSHAHKFQEFLWSLLFVKFNYHSQRLDRRVWCINLVLHLKKSLFLCLIFNHYWEKVRKIANGCHEKGFYAKRQIVLQHEICISKLPKRPTYLSNGSW